MAVNWGFLLRMRWSWAEENSDAPGRNEPTLGTSICFTRHKRTASCPVFIDSVHFTEEKIGLGDEM